jgi:hypothetical protein
MFAPRIGGRARLSDAFAAFDSVQGKSGIPGENSPRKSNFKYKLRSIPGQSTPPLSRSQQVGEFRIFLHEGGGVRAARFDLQIL